jgi:hypothetical protein
MRTKYLRRTYTLHIRWQVPDDDYWGKWVNNRCEIGVPPMGPAAARAIVVQHAITEERIIERAWLSVYNRGNTTEKEINWLLDLHMTSAMPRSALRKIVRTRTASARVKIIPIIGDTR